MKRYLRIYKVLLDLNFSTLVAYRANFINSAISSLAWALFSIMSIYLMTFNVNAVFGWKRNEILLLTSIYSILIGIFHMLFSKNFERMAHVINLGELDIILLKPVDGQFLLSLWLINYTSIVRIIIGIIFTVYLAQLLSLTNIFSKLVLALPVIFAGVLLLYSIWYIVATLTIWYTRISNVMQFMYSVSGMTRYPREMYRQLNNYIFLFFIPLTFIVVSPVKVILNKITYSEIIGLLIMSFAFFYISRKFWKFALRYYTSASS